MNIFEKAKEGYSETMEYDFEKFSNVIITGVDLTSLDEEDSSL